MNVHVKTLETDARPQTRRASILMCAPRHFGVDYVINPWMERQIGRTDTARARDQWENLRRHLAACADLAFVTGEPGLPDMVFTANAGLVVGDAVIVSRFHAKERQPEESLFRRWFEDQGYDVAPWPEDVAFEGAGDALADHARRVIWCGHGWRSSRQAPGLVETISGWSTIGLKLVDPRFYHLDTCFSPLPGGWLMYYPAAFDEESREKIRAMTPTDKRIEVDETDARGFACNAVEVAGRIFMNACSDALAARLAAAGFEPIVTPLSEFLKAGGAAKCLTLELKRDSL